MDGLKIIICDHIIQILTFLLIFNHNAKLVKDTYSKTQKNTELTKNKVMAKQSGTAGMLNIFKLLPVAGPENVPITS